MTDAATKSYGPLFACLAPKFTRDDAYWHSRHNVARGVESLHQSIGPGKRALSSVMMAFIEFHARRWCGEHFDGLKAHAVKTYPDYLGYGYGFWQRVLTGEEIVYGWQRVENRKPGEPAVVPSATCRLDPAPLTRDQFFELFPYADAPLGPEPDDGGLFERTIGQLGGPLK
jgi:hypothetical protein